MITNSIDGSSGNNQILDLLSLVAVDPKTYANKLKEIQDATAEHKKYVEAVCPVADIIRAKDKADEDKKSAKDALDEANGIADTLVSVAKAESQSILDVANSEAKDTTAKAELLKATSEALMADAQQASIAATKAQAKADGDTLAAQEKSKDLTAAIANAEAAQKDVENTKADILAKHQAFIKSL